MPRSDATLMTALGFSPPVSRLYDRLLLHDRSPLAEVAESLDLTPAELRARMEPLSAYGIVTVADDRILVAAPADAVARMISETAAGAADAHARLEEIAGALPLLAGTGVRRAPDEPSDSEPIDGEVTAGPDWGDLVHGILRESVGDLLWLRPDQWTMPWEPEMSEIVRQALKSGRRCRAIYPVRVLTEAPAVVRMRVEIGEEVRLVPELPSRMIVVGSSHLLLPEPLGFVASPRTIVRQRSIVELATLFFEQLWAQATMIEEPEVRAGDLRRLVLQQLAGGAQDEQIARRLGLSLRTVRRRVAELMEELGAHSRFQAGMEASRRGWL
jgi:DNA-binding Lrp family transcriptional regulator